MTTDIPTDERLIATAPGRGWAPTIAVATAAAVGAAVLVFLVARAFGVELQVPDPSTGELMALPVVAVVLAAAVPSALAGGIAWLVSRSTPRPRVSFVSLAVVATLLSFAPVFGGDVPNAAQPWLATMHLAVAGTVIPLLARRTPAVR
jgi:hypothetical protein